MLYRAPKWLKPMHVPGFYFVSCRLSTTVCVLVTHSVDKTFPWFNLEINLCAMKKLVSAVVLIGFGLLAWGQTVELKEKDLPKEVHQLLDRYLSTLAESTDLDDCATRIAPLLGGSLLSAEGVVSNTVKPYSLKKDFNNVKFYQLPAKITRVQLRKNARDGYDALKLEGVVYKIWVAKKEGVNGMPAPVPILVPTNDPQHPRVVATIGNL